MVRRYVASSIMAVKDKADCGVQIVNSRVMRDVTLATVFTHAQSAPLGFLPTSTSRKLCPPRVQQEHRVSVAMGLGQTSESRPLDAHITSVSAQE